jgi:hypothetical protein
MNAPLPYFPSSKRGALTPFTLALYEKKISRSLKLNICVIDLNQLL